MVEEAAALGHPADPVVTMIEDQAVIPEEEEIQEGPTQAAEDPLAVVAPAIWK